MRYIYIIGLVVTTVDPQKSLETKRSSTYLIVESDWRVTDPPPMITIFPAHLIKILR